MRTMQLSELQLPERFAKKLRQDMTYLLSYKDIEIKQIILFGSCARGDCKVTSDLDILLITKESIQRQIRGDIASELEEELDQVRTDVVFYSEPIFEQSDSLFIKQVRKDGIIIYNQEGDGGEYHATK
ncbi:hypothetical protein CS063_11920 [Sporanaerobium hydrogeniformans]|uniref:Uncharacterized protein n=1 Tax=Sporanaerobium hydrogeniformans TaxID=3072179 RepID=A0AC61DBS8_9FIRM|nr:nucleotidyltransferase domain-containing protein [Sporanaerobium hydrogeniformans]PHV70178.1 hypothetical protein CS063_11920 [Sporanaerobium hydrogeniformans]